MAAAIVFRAPGATSLHPQTLLIRRAPTDSYPTKWEIPGGSTSDRKDASIIAGAVRELHEETGLTAKKVLYPIGMLGDTETTAPGKLGITPEEEGAKNEGDDAQTVTFLETGDTWGKVTLVVDVHEDLEDGKDTESVRVRDGEHDRWAWATEEEVRMGKWKGGEEIGFVSEGVWRTVLQGFREYGAREGARLMRRFPGMANKEP